jgi:hypothetical protein
MTECFYAECHYAECRYAECRGAQQINQGTVLLQFLRLLLVLYRNRLECLTLTVTSTLF